MKLSLLEVVHGSGGVFQGWFRSTFYMNIIVGVATVNCNQFLVLHVANQFQAPVMYLLSSTGMSLD
jgi:hypothetical protein